jgi:hypothetical protein
MMTMIKMTTGFGIAPKKKGTHITLVRPLDQVSRALSL